MTEHLQPNNSEWSAPVYYGTMENENFMLRYGPDANAVDSVRRISMEPQLKVENRPSTPVEKEIAEVAVNAVVEAPGVTVPDSQQASNGAEGQQAVPDVYNTRRRSEILAEVEADKQAEAKSLETAFEALRSKHSEADNRYLFFYASNVVDAKKAGNDHNLANIRMGQAQNYAAKLSGAAKQDAQKYLDLWIRMSRLKDHK